MFANVNIGTYPGDGSGDPLRTAFEIINRNFSNIASGNITVNAPVLSVADRTGNVHLTFADVAGSASTAYVDMAVMAANTAAQVYTDAAISNSLDIPSLTANIINSVTAGVTANISYQGFNANITAANTEISRIDANLGTAVTNISSLSVLAGQLQTAINNNSANVTAANAAILAITANLTAIASGVINANVTAANTAISVLDANLGTVTTNIVSLQNSAYTQDQYISAIESSIANLQAYPDSINSDIGNLQVTLTGTQNIAASLVSSVSQLQANIGTIFLNSGTLFDDVAAQQSRIAGTESNVSTLSSSVVDLNTKVYNNSNVAAYISTYNGFVRANTVYAGNIYGNIITGHQDQIISVGTLDNLTVAGDTVLQGNLALLNGLIKVGDMVVTGNVHFDNNKTTINSTNLITTVRHLVLISDLTDSSQAAGAGLMTPFSSLVYSPTFSAWTSNVNIIPATTNSYNLGTSGILWANVFAGNIHGTINTSNQPNITAVGTLANLAVAGSITVAGLTPVVSSTSRQIWVANTAPSPNQGSVGDIWYQTY
jgi:hypothetical protein